MSNINYNKDHTYLGLNNNWDSDYLGLEPLRFHHDVFSVSYNFYFIKECIITPKLNYNINNVSYSQTLTSVHTKVNEFTKI